MSARQKVVVAGAVCFAALMALGLWLGNVNVSPEELVIRCRESHPEWRRYQEDVKGQIGAKPIAAWEGRPVEAKQDGAKVVVVLQVAPPWAGYDAVLPILLRDPLGVVHSPESSQREGALCRYTFSLDADGVQTLPWFEVRFPRGEMRIALDARGCWREP